MLNQRTLTSFRELVSSNEISMHGKDVHHLLLESVDDVLADLLGKRVREAFYDHMERNYHLSREDIPRHLDDFLMLLERAFGVAGKAIGKVIAKRLYTKLGWE